MYRHQVCKYKQLMWYNHVLGGGGISLCACDEICACVCDVWGETVNVMCPLFCLHRIYSTV